MESDSVLNKAWNERKKISQKSIDDYDLEVLRATIAAQNRVLIIDAKKGLDTYS